MVSPLFLLGLLQSSYMVSDLLIFLRSPGNICKRQYRVQPRANLALKMSNALERILYTVEDEKEVIIYVENLDIPRGQYKMLIMQF